MKIAFIVVTLHVLLLVLLFQFHTSLPKKSARTPILVNTIIVEDSPKRELMAEAKTEIGEAPAQKEPVILPPTVLALQTPKEEQPAPTVKKELPAQERKQQPPPQVTNTKKEAVKAPAKTAPAPKVPPKKESNQEQLVTLMQKTLAHLNHNSTPSAKIPSVPVKSPPLGKLSCEALAFEKGYEEELVAHLEALLSLPEKGEVKLKLTLKRDGKVYKFEIVHAKSEKLRQCIEQSLATLTLPAFGSRFKGEEMHTFTLTLKSD